MSVFVEKVAAGLGDRPKTDVYQPQYSQLSDDKIPCWMPLEQGGAPRAWV